MRNLKFIYFSFLHLIIGVLLIHLGFNDDRGVSFSDDEQMLKFTPHYRQMLKYHKRMDKAVPEGSVIFIGDSNTQGLCVSAVIIPSVNYGIGGDTTSGVLKRLPSYASIERSKAVVLSVGTNDMKTMGNEEILENYQDIIESIPRSIPVVVNGVLPVVAERLRSSDTRNMQIIEELNVGLRELASRYGNVRYMDVTHSLLDQAEGAPDRYYAGDGIHLNPDGLLIWIEELHTVISEI